MFKSDDDIKKTLLEIRKIKDFLDMHMSDASLKQKAPKELQMELEKLKLSLNFFNEFNATFLKSIGVDEKQLNRSMQMHVVGRDSKLQALFEEADQLKCELLISEAQFIQKNFKDYIESNRPFEESKNKSPERKQAQKKKVKKKFKNMNQRMKWNKM